MVKYIIPLCFLASCASKQPISDKASIDGAIKNLNELNRWVYYDHDKGDISDKTMRESVSYTHLTLPTKRIV